MRKLLLTSVVVSVILISCIGRNDAPTPVLSVTPKQTFTTTPTSTRTPRPTVTPTITKTPLPSYQNKKILLDYYVTGYHSLYDGFFEQYTFRTYSRVVLYDDGQLIIIPSNGEFGETYKQRILSSGEIDRLISKLEELGFYSIETNQKHDSTDKLYNYGENHQITYDGVYYCVFVNTANPRKLCAYEPDIQYINPKMRHVLNYLNEYKPIDMTLYYPDRLLLLVKLGRDPYDDNLPETTIDWNKGFPRLKTSVIYVDGDLAKEIYSLYDSTIQGKVFLQDGIEYTIHINVVLPHEELTNTYSYP